MKKEKNKLKVPHTLVLIFSIIIIMAILTFVIPGGNYQREAKDGRQVVIPDSFQRIEHEPQDLGAVLLAPFRGFVDAVEIIAFVIIVGGAFAVIQCTGAIDGMIRSILNKKKHQAIQT